MVKDISANDARVAICAGGPEETAPSAGAGTSQAPLVSEAWPVCFQFTCDI